MSYDWTQFEQHIYIKAPIERVFNAWMSEKELTQWFLETVAIVDENGRQRPANESCKPRDTYRWTWHGAWEYVEQGKILDVKENSYLKFSFSNNKVIVELRFIQHLNEVQLILTQSQIPTDEENKINVHMGCNLGWSFWIVNLKAWLEHGILLNDKADRIPHAANQ